MLKEDNIIILFAIGYVCLLTTIFEDHMSLGQSSFIFLYIIYSIGSSIIVKESLIYTYKEFMLKYIFFCWKGSDNIKSKVCMVMNQYQKNYWP